MFCFLFSEINDSAQGFLYDWWTMFYDVYVYRQCRKGQNVEGKARVNVMVCLMKTFSDPAFFILRCVVVCG